MRFLCSKERVTLQSPKPLTGLTVNLTNPQYIERKLIDINKSL